MASYEVMGREPSYQRHRRMSILYALRQRKRRRYSAGMGASARSAQAAYMGGEFLGGRRKKLSAEQRRARKIRAAGVVTGTASGASIGASVGSAVPVIGTAIGTAAGAVIGTVGGMFKVYGKKWRQKIRKRRAERKRKKSGSGSVTPITKTPEPQPFDVPGASPQGIPSIGMPPEQTLVSPEMVMPPTVETPEMKDMTTGEIIRAGAAPGGSGIAMFVLAGIGLYVASQVFLKKKPGGVA